GVPAGPLFGRLQRGETVTLDDGTEVTPGQVLGETRSGRSFAYISDTRPSPSVVDFVQGVDVLVHEATYLHEFADQARDRGHSTAREAAQVAERAGVGRLILTHISPKHHSKREILSEAREIFPNTELASDLASFELPIPA
ncbi:MAG: ribonuclease Z, partial [Bradymonadia bacterium]